MDRWRPRLQATAALALLSLALSSCGFLGGSGPATTPTPTSPYNKYVAAEERAFHTALKDVHVSVPRKTGEAAPALPAGAFGGGLGSKEVLGFLPSWEMGDAATVDYEDLSEICYYALQVEPGGTILRQGSGWDSLEDGSVGTLVSDAHAVGTRALLTLFTETQSTLAELASNPTKAGESLADQAAPLLETNKFDGVDLDLEGQQASSRNGFVSFVAAFSKRLRAIDSTWTIVLNTFPQAAVDPTNFFNVKALAPYVNQLFVMAYDMGDTQEPGPTAPLVGDNLTDASALASYVATVPPAKVILGIPFYGYDFTASRGKLPADTIGSPDAVTYDSIVASPRSALWDPASETPYQSFKLSGTWHQLWFEDPTSVALKVALAAAFKVGGVGSWELGMASGQPQMTATLDGGSPPVHGGLATEP